MWIKYELILIKNNFELAQYELQTYVIKAKKNTQFSWDWYCISVLIPANTGTVYDGMKA
jgi:hypothetical protein